MNKPEKNPNHRLYYTERTPSQLTKHLARCFFEFSIKGNSTNPIPHHVFPNGCVSIIYRRNNRLKIEMLLLKGISLETFETEVFTDDIHWGLTLAPSASNQVLRCDPKIIQTQPVFDTKILPHILDGLIDELSQCKSFGDAVNVFEAGLKSLNIDKDQTDQKVAQSIRIIEKQFGEVKIADLAKQVGIGRRQLERRFRKSAGITPKQLARTYRLRYTGISLLEKDANWATRAAELGFTDQSHLVKELKTLTGQSPKSFKKRIESIEHDAISGALKKDDANLQD